MIRGYDFHTVIQNLNTLLAKKQPETLNPLWIERHSDSAYEYFCEHHQNGIGDIDWDFVTIHLERTFQKRWKWSGAKRSILYNDKEEVDIILSKYQDKLYTLTAPQDKQDKFIQDQIIIRLARLAQRGNVLAKEQVITYMAFIIYEWMDSSRYISRWKGHADEIEKKIESCIRNYHYSGSYMKYIFMTLYYSARGLRPTVSLDDTFCNGKKRRMDYVIQEEEDF